ncbi:MAG TPA: hypothetical protein VFR80_12345 [Pyrinomonadaceae bacterium]|nr:hypothetical protein [Pyrinomonadaceae bacterium]
MHTAAYVIVMAMIATALYFGIRWLVRASSKYRSSRTVACPETGRPALVEIDALHASLTSLVGRPDIRLESCSRWPMKNQCGQECLANLDVAPGECLVSGVLMRWYRGKNCAYCGKPAEELHWIDHKPALETPAGQLMESSEVPVDKLPLVLKSHLPVCWDCYIAQTFRQNHPELVVFRPWRNSIPGDSDGLSASHRL